MVKPKRFLQNRFRGLKIPVEDRKGLVFPGPGFRDILDHWNCAGRAHGSVEEALNHGYAFFSFCLATIVMVQI